MNQEVKMFSINQAAYLKLMSGIAPEIRLQDDRVSYTFVFEKTKEIDKLVSEYQNGEAYGNINDFNRYFTTLKKELKNIKYGRK